MNSSYITKRRMTIQALRKSIKSLKRLNLASVEIEELKAQLAPILHHYVSAAPLIQVGDLIIPRRVLGF